MALPVCVRPARPCVPADGPERNRHLPSPPQRGQPSKHSLWWLPSSSLRTAGASFRASSIPTPGNVTSLTGNPGPVNGSFWYLASATETSGVGRQCTRACKCRHRRNASRLQSQRHSCECSLCAGQHASSLHALRWAGRRQRLPASSSCVHGGGPRAQRSKRDPPHRSSSWH